MLNTKYTEGLITPQNENNYNRNNICYNRSRSGHTAIFLKAIFFLEKLVDTHLLHPPGSAHGGKQLSANLQDNSGENKINLTTIQYNAWSTVCITSYC